MYMAIPTFINSYPTSSLELRIKLFRLALIHCIHSYVVCTPIMHARTYEEIIIMQLSMQLSTMLYRPNYFFLLPDNLTLVTPVYSYSYNNVLSKGYPHYNTTLRLLEFTQ